MESPTGIVHFGGIKADEILQIQKACPMRNIFNFNKNFEKLTLVNSFDRPAKSRGMSQNARAL